MSVSQNEWVSHQMHERWQPWITGDQKQEHGTLQTEWATSRINNNARTEKHFYIKTNEGAKWKEARVNHTRARTRGKTKHITKSESCFSTYRSRVEQDSAWHDDLMVPPKSSVIQLQVCIQVFKAAPPAFKLLICWWDMSCVINMCKEQHIA